ncbi:sulfite exporter TauE/SafE family protein [Pyruvatibacter mobilis]|uniref:sulfite exporter TauE/SafE family protein n=1 Tax=Pyruvatibacter mobilis TaxID=1712261 RepID=UPI003BB1FEEF
MDIASIDFSILFVFVGALAAAGILAGLVAGLFGVGGGIVIVPVLYYVFTAFDVPEEVRMHVAVGTSLATIVVTSIRSVRSHLQSGAVDVPLLKSWILPITAGVVAGTAVADIIDGTALTLVFGSIALLVAANMAFAKSSWQLADDLPGRPGRDAIGATIGFLSTLMGIGGGTFGNTVMTLCGRTIHQAVATSAGLGLIIAVPGALGFVISGWDETGTPPGSVGYVNFIAFACIVPATILMAPVGARLAHRLPQKTLKRGFALFLAIVAIRMLYGVLA